GLEKGKGEDKIVTVPIAELFRTHTKNTILGLGARYIEGVTFNIYGVFIVGYLTGTLHMPRQSALTAVMLSSAIMIVMLPICGRWSDRVGRRLLFGTAGLLIGVRSEEHTSELQSLTNLVCRLLLEKKTS